MTCASPKIPDPVDNRGSALTPWSCKYPDELRERAVREVRTTGRPIAHVARDLGVHKEALRGWVRQAEADAGLLAESDTGIEHLRGAAETEDEAAVRSASSRAALADDGGRVSGTPWAWSSCGRGRRPP
ncbi:transposase [Streptomyces sp. NPDC007856]|uniref:transposase n=1 Tax=Streptomyces sp. NPDC007856 TaxID=3364781 RepID=UPI0036BA11A0